jgi:trehalose 6-phosphate synthase/phosphatase
MLFNSSDVPSAKQLQDLQFIQRHSTKSWAQAFLTDLKNCRKNVRSKQTVVYDFLPHGLGDKVKIIALKRSFQSLNENFFLDALKNSQNCALFLDVEGTLCETYTNLEASEGPSPAVLKALDNLAGLPNFSVYVITGRKSEVLEKWFARAPKIGLAAEYGMYLRHSERSDWEVTYESVGKWREMSLRIIQNYVERTDGSFIEEKGCSIVFQHREADPDYGALQAKELASHLENLLMQHMNECEVSTGLGYVEVKPRGMGKGAAVLSLLKGIVAAKGPVDMIFAAGDDVSDEEMFRALHVLKTEQQCLTVSKENLTVISCTIGQKPSDADYFVSDYSPFTTLLKFADSYCRSDRHLSIPKNLSWRSGLLATSAPREPDDFRETPFTSLSEEDFVV